MVRVISFILAMMVSFGVQSQVLDTIFNGYLSPMIDTAGSAPTWHFKAQFVNEGKTFTGATVSANSKILVSSGGRCYELDINSVSYINGLLRGTVTDSSGVLTDLPSYGAIITPTNGGFYTYPSGLPQVLQSCIQTHNWLNAGSSTANNDIDSSFVRNDSIFISQDGQEYFTGAGPPTWYYYAGYNATYSLPLDTLAKYDRILIQCSTFTTTTITLPDIDSNPRYNGKIIEVRYSTLVGSTTVVKSDDGIYKYNCSGYGSIEPNLPADTLEAGLYDLVRYTVGGSANYYRHCPAINTPGSSPPDTARFIVYAPGHGLSDSITTNGLVPVKADFTQANASAFDSTHFAYAIDAPTTDSLELKLSGPFTVTGHGLTIGRLYHLQDDGTFGITSGTIRAPIFYVLDANTLVLTEVGSDQDQVISRQAVPSPVFTFWGGDPQNPSDSIMQVVVDSVFAPAGLAKPSTIFFMSYSSQSKNPTYQDDSPTDSPINPSHSWFYDGNVVTRMNHLLTSVDLQATSAGLFTLDTVMLVGGVPTDSTVANWLDTNYVQNNLRLPNGAILYWQGSGTPQSPDYSWIVIDDITNTGESNGYKRILKRLGGAVYVDNSTILGNGTGGSPFRVDTTLLATRYYADSLFALADSLRADGDKSAPILVPVFDRNTQLDGCSTAETIYTGFLLIDNEAIDEGAITFEINASPATVTYDVYNADSTSYYFETSASRGAGVYFWEVSYTDSDGNNVGDTNAFDVMSGTPDSVLIVVQDSILVLRVCGVEISRDTLPEGNPGTVTSVALSLPGEFAVSGSPVTSSGNLSGTWNTQAANTVLAGPASGGAAAPTFRSLVAADITAGGGGISGTLTDDTLPVYEASGDTLTDSYLSQVADGLVLAANKYLQITGWATAGEPVAGVGLFGYDTDNDVFRMSDGVSWFSPAGVSKTSGKFTQNRIPYADVNGLLTDDANFNFTSGTLNCPATVTISGSGATVRVTNQNAKTYVFGQGLVLNTFTIGYGFGGFGISVTEQNRVGIGISNQTARFQLPAGTATASTAPFKFTLTGHVPLTTPEAGVLSPNAAFDRLSYTNNSAVRKELAFTDDISNIDTADLNLASTGNESWPLQFNLAGYDDGMEFRYDEGSDSDLGDRVGTIQWRPRYGGSIQNEVAAITGIYDGDGTTRKGRLHFFTHNGSSFIKALDLSNDSILVNADYTRFNNGSVGINTSGAPTAQLEVNGTVKVTGITTLLSAVNMTGTSALQVHTGTTAQRPGTPVQGQIRTNTDNDTVEGYDGTKWKALDNKAYTPTSTADSYGSEGDIVYDDDYIYIKTSAGWKRSALSTF